MKNTFNKKVSVILIVFCLIMSYEYNYAQDKRSDVAKDIPRYEYRDKNNNNYSDRDAGFYEYSRKINSRKYKPDEDLKYYHRNTKNYFRIDHSGNSLWNGKHWMPDKFPLKVHITRCESAKYKKIFKEYVEYGFKVWQKADARISYKFTSSPDEADIVVIFEENLMEKYDENFLGLTDYELEVNRQIKLSTVEISLLKYKNERLSEGEIKATIIHEIGHALGLGHSTNSADLMYPYIDPDSSVEMNYEELSRGDREAIRSVIDLCYFMKYSLN